jgi:CDP-diacylglycerol--glycerol-3-phosphate 3-phosphatidyltransferase
MDKELLKQKVRDRTRPIVLFLDRLGFTPLAVSVVGLVISILSGVAVGQGHLFWGALVFLLGSSFDMLDGSLARLQGTVSRRGAFLDSVFDRFGEAALFAGLAWYYMTQLDEPRPVTVMFILATVVGSLTTSYVRARAEGVGETCYVGLLQRPERIVLLVVGMILGWHVLEVVLAVLAATTLATSVQRVWHVCRKLPGADPSPSRPEDPPGTPPASPGVTS